MSQPISRFWSHDITAYTQRSSIVKSESSNCGCLVEIRIRFEDKFIAYTVDIFGVIETLDIE